MVSRLLLEIYLGTIRCGAAFVRCDHLAAGGAAQKATRQMGEGARTWVVFLELGHIVDVAVDDDVQVLRRLVGGDVRRGEGLGHG